MPEKECFFVVKDKVRQDVPKLDEKPAGHIMGSRLYIYCVLHQRELISPISTIGIGVGLSLGKVGGLRKFAAVQVVQ